MSKHINVNPDHYKVAGRERQGEEILHERNKREMALEEKMRTRQRVKARAGARKPPRKP